MLQKQVDEHEQRSQIMREAAEVQRRMQEETEVTRRTQQQEALQEDMKRRKARNEEWIQQRAINAVRCLASCLAASAFLLYCTCVCVSSSCRASEWCMYAGSCAAQCCVALQCTRWGYPPVSLQYMILLWDLPLSLPFRVQRATRWGFFRSSLNHQDDRHRKSDAGN